MSHIFIGLCDGGDEMKCGDIILVTYVRGKTRYQQSYNTQ